MFTFSQRFKALSLALGLLMSPHSALAQDTSSETNASQANRGVGRATILVQPIGFGQGIQNALRLEYSQPGDMRIGLLLQQGTELSDLFDTFQAYSTTAALYIKRYAGNSFYFELGAAAHERNVRTKDYTYDFRSDGSFGAVYYDEEDYRKQDIGLQLGLGNQWQWEHFTLGCEWVGAYVPIQATGFSGKSRRHLTSGEEQELSLGKKKNNLNTSLRALNFSFGWQF
jgi:hypothetical protein